ncbi:MAG: DUF2085 domain-containing protein [Clostridia bacterium]|nr:DUF2085 domain-containing protein [Clostridia bacterium]
MGRLSGCHQRPDRSFFLKGRQFPVCARCTGVVVGYFCGAVLYPFFNVPLWLTVLFCMLMLTDWLVQRIDLLPSTNLRRFCTGVLCGLGLIARYLDLLLCLIKLI